MTNKEVISTLKLLKKCYIYYFDASDNDALDIAIKALEQQPCEDCISREAVRRILANQRDELIKLHTVNPKDNPKADAMAYGINWSLNTLMELPSVTPKYTDEEIDKAQAVEQAYIDKMVELTVEDILDGLETARINAGAEFERLCNI